VDPVTLLEQYNSLALGPFLLWLFFRMEKKLDAQSEKLDAQRKEYDDRYLEMVKGWEKQLTAVIHKFEEREDEVRSRYDAVVQKYDDERSRIFRDMDRKLEDAIRFMTTR
tara:strand:- start:325 stop:654 length:330 start_codon:yes stop_codon:yes gene_type:complete